MLTREAAFKLIAPRALAQGSAEAMEVVRLRFELPPGYGRRIP